MLIDKHRNLSFNNQYAYCYTQSVSHEMTSFPVGRVFEQSWAEYSSSVSEIHCEFFYDNHCVVIPEYTLSSINQSISQSDDERRLR